jgi:uncharacterized membrane protein YqiK
MPKKIQKDYAAQYQEIQDRNSAMEALVYRLGQMLRKQTKQLEEMVAPEPPKAA